MDKQEEIIVDGVTYIREDLMDAVIRQYRIERDEALEHICSPNERAFLDEIRESFEFDYDKNLWCRKNRNMLERSYIYRSDFTKTNLSGLVEGEG